MIRLHRGQAIDLLDWLRASCDLSTAKDTPIQTILEQIEDQVGNPNHQNDLVDVIANLLQSPKGKIAMSGKMITALREAVLSPRELAKAKAMIHTTQACAGCGRAVVDSELVTMRDQSPLCYSCLRPSFLSCPQCSMIHGLPGSVTRILTKVLKECQRCAAGPSTAPEVMSDERMQDEQVQNELDRMRRFMEDPPSLRTLATEAIQAGRGGVSRTPPTPTFRIAPSPEAVEAARQRLRDGGWTISEADLQQPPAPGVWTPDTTWTATSPVVGPDENL